MRMIETSLLLGNSVSIAGDANKEGRNSLFVARTFIFHITSCGVFHFYFFSWK